MHLKKVGDVAGNGTTHPPVQTISTNDSIHCFITDQTPTLMFHPRGSFDAWMRGTSCVDDMEGIAAGCLLTSRDRLTVSTSSRFWYSYEHGSRSVVFSISVWGSLGWKCRSLKFRWVYTGEQRKECRRLLGHSNLGRNSVNLQVSLKKPNQAPLSFSAPRLQIQMNRVGYP